MAPPVTKPFAEYSIVRLRRRMTDDKGRPVEEGATGTIVRVHATPRHQEPAYIVEVIRTPTDSSLIDARHRDLDGEEEAVAPPLKTPWTSWLMFAFACLCGIGSALILISCVDVIRQRSGWGAVGFMYVGPVFGLICLGCAVIASALYAHSRRRLDLASVLLTSGAVLVVVVLFIIIRIEFSAR